MAKVEPPKIDVKALATGDTLLIQFDSGEMLQLYGAYGSMSVTRPDRKKLCVLTNDKDLWSCAARGPEVWEDKENGEPANTDEEETTVFPQKETVKEKPVSAASLLHGGDSE